MRPVMGSLVKTIDTVTNIGAAVGGVFTGAMTLIVGYAVIVRHVFNSPIGWSEEISEYLVVWAVFIGAAYTLKKDAHIGVDILTSRLKPQTKRIFLLFQYLVGIVFFSILLYTGIEMVALSLKMDSRSMAIEFPLFIAHLSVPIGSTILILQCFRKILSIGSGRT